MSSKEPAILAVLKFTTRTWATSRVRTSLIGSAVGLRYRSEWASPYPIMACVDLRLRGVVIREATASLLLTFGYVVRASESAHRGSSLPYR